MSEFFPVIIFGVVIVMILIITWLAEFQLPYLYLFFVFGLIISFALADIYQDSILDGEYRLARGNFDMAFVDNLPRKQHIEYRFINKETRF